MNSDEILARVGRVPRNPFLDLIVSIRKFRSRIYVALETVPAGADGPEESERPRIMSLTPETTKALLPLLAEAQALAVRFTGDD